MTSPAPPEPACATCNDEGTVVRTVIDNFVYRDPCPDCACQDCGGTGRLPCERHQSPNCPCHREPCPCRSLEVD